ncbi:MAG TPA: hypothetical protein VF184_02200, partial [Phycisphaeraceae bacterium]
ADDLRDKARAREILVSKGRDMLRFELTQLERFVLLQILDTAWKEHLYAMDQLKDSIGLRGYAERDPRIEYKREGSNLFAQMQRNVRDRVTELIFKARLTPNVQIRSVYGAQQQARHEAAGSAVQAAAQQASRQAPPAAAQAAAVAASRGSDQQQADLEAAQRAGSDGNEPRYASRRQRRAAQAQPRKPESTAAPQKFKQRKKKRR